MHLRKKKNSDVWYLRVTHTSIRKKQFRWNLIKFPLLVGLDKGNVSKYQLLIVPDSNFQWDIEVRGLEVYVATIYYQRHLRDSKLNLVTVIRFAMNRVILPVNLYLIMKLFSSELIRSSPPRFFLWNNMFH